MTWMSILAMLKSSIVQTVAISGMMFALGVYTGSSLAIKYYKIKEVAALNAQIAHNERVILWSRKEITKLLDEEQKLEELVRTLNEEADKDPDRDKPSINIDGVRRLNKADYSSGTPSPARLSADKTVLKAGQAP